MLSITGCITQPLKSTTETKLYDEGGSRGGGGSKELIGRSFYDFYHALDNPAIEKCHRDCKLYDEGGGGGGVEGMVVIL